MHLSASANNLTLKLQLLLICQPQRDDKLSWSANENSKSTLQPWYVDIDNFCVLLTVCTGDDQLFNVHTAVNVANELQNHTYVHFRL